MAYAAMSGTYAISAFYTCIIASLMYGIIGSSRRLSYGVFSLVSAIYLGIVINRVKVKLGTKFDIAELVSMFTLFVGFFSAIASILRLATLVRFIPYEVMSAFRAGLYLLVFTMQLNTIFGIEHIRMDLGDGHELLTLPRLFSIKWYPHLTNHINWNCVILSAGCILVFALIRFINFYWHRVFGCKALIVRNIIRLIPIEFIVVVIGFLVSKHTTIISSRKIHLIEPKLIGNETDGYVKIII